MTRLGRRGLLGLARSASAPATAPTAPPTALSPTSASVFAPDVASRPAPASVAAPRPTKSSAPFSLDAFYARRSLEGPASDALPHFELRPGLPGVPSTRIGVPALGVRPVAAPPAAPPTALPGAPRVRRSLCLAWQRTPCAACLDRCPVEGALVVEQGKPRVAEDHCTACGACVLACPAPVNAFAIPDAPEPR